MNSKMVNISLTAERDTAFDLKFPGEVVRLECSQSDVLKESKFGANYRAIELQTGEEISIHVKLK